MIRSRGDSGELIDPSVIDTAWLVLAAALVFLMQAGFCALESGFVRARNTINVAAKNLIDFCIAGCLFWAVGFGLMFGESEISAAGVEHGWPAAFFLFQLMFCGTAVTLVSGAVAERIRFGGYAVLAILVSGFIYPFAGSWAWAGLDGGEAGWLAEMGFVDFAGSTVVHSVGGWVALAAVLVIGPRHGRFDRGAAPPQPDSLPLASLGLLFLWFGWIGFNGGSVLAMNGAVAPIIVNTMLAACAGGLAAVTCSRAIFGRPRIDGLINGVLGGLVAITAGADVVGPTGALAIGALGGMIITPSTLLLARLRIDDAVAAVPVHLFAGIWGTLAVALFGDPEMLGRSWTEQLRIQAIGVAAYGGFTFAVSLTAIWALSRVMRLRATATEQQIGLNASEHDASSAAHDLALAMEERFRRGDVGESVPVEIGSDVEIVARQYNRVAMRVKSDTARLEKSVEELAVARDAAEAANRAKSAFLANMSHELRTPLNAIIGFSEIMVKQTFGALGNDRYSDYAGDIHGAGTHLLGIVNDMLDHTSIEAGKVDLNEREIDLAQTTETVTRSVRPIADRSGVNLRADSDPDQPLLSGDERIVRQILLNLINNAIKFTPEGGRVEVVTRLEPDNRLAIVVTDTGIGMDRSEIARAMEPFVQLNEDYNKTHGGTGLGLPLVKSMVKLHGGTLTIDSMKDHGTTVIVRFPAARTIAAAEAAD
ncbi:histidine kinase [Minwuia thermotolerans]|uniref:Ammonium transporter n=1 Tax=Minwuia thermotolerans TaxID=2056226 RepID=A0A2M9G516_9PROT|nr:histidine kinase [Minwuia thermotolerans]